MKVVTILGMHRSGTSALSGMLHTAGYIAGHTLLPPNAHNETGYYESRVITDMNDSILNESGNTWDDVRKISIHHADSNSAKAFTSRIVECFECEYSDAENAVLKDPRICRLLPLWIQAFASLGITPLYVLALRSPAEVAASLKRRDGMTIQKSALLYLAYLLDAEQNTREKDRLIVTYSELLADPLSVLEKIDARCENDFHSRGREQLALVETFIDSSLRHEVESCDWNRMQASKPMRLAQELYEALSSRDAKFDEYYFRSIRCRFDAMLEDLEPWLSDAAYGKQLRREILAPSKESRKAANLYAHAAVYWRTNAKDFCEEQKIVHAVTFDEKTCELKFCLPPTNSPITDLRLDPIDRPAYCQIERFSIHNQLGEVAWQADLNHDLFSFTSGHMINLGKKDIGSNSYDVVATGDDAYGTLSIPRSILDKIGPEWILNVDLRFDLLVQAIEPICQNLLKFKGQIQPAK
jgi:hypothetical protein